MWTFQLATCTGRDALNHHATSMESDTSTTLDIAAMCREETSMEYDENHKISMASSSVGGELRGIANISGW